MHVYLPAGCCRCWRPSSSSAESHERCPGSRRSLCEREHLWPHHSAMNKLKSRGSLHECAVIEACVPSPQCHAQVGEQANGLEQPVAVDVGSLFQDLRFESGEELQLGAGQKLCQVRGTALAPGLCDKVTKALCRQIHIRICWTRCSLREVSRAEKFMWECLGSGCRACFMVAAVARHGCEALKEGCQRCAALKRARCTWIVRRACILPSQTNLGSNLPAYAG